MYERITHPQQWPEFRTTWSYRLSEVHRKHKKDLEKWHASSRTSSRPMHPNRGEESGRDLAHLNKFITNIDTLYQEYDKARWKHELRSTPETKKRLDEKHDEMMQALSVMQRLLMEYKLKYAGKS